MNSMEIFMSMGLILISLTLTISGYVVARMRLVRILMFIWLLVLCYRLISLGWATEFDVNYIYTGAISFILWVAIKEKQYSQ